MEDRMCISSESSFLDCIHYIIGASIVLICSYLGTGDKGRIGGYLESLKDDLEKRNLSEDSKSPNA